ncbi:hypothetical protein VTI74DRAFT_162 [Chaetomium olivicolor]
MRLTAELLLLCSALIAQTAAYSTPHQQRPLVDNNAIIPPSHGDAPSYRVPLLTLHRDLVNVPSISGSEGDAALLLEKLLTKLNYTVHLQLLPSSAPTSGNTQPRYNVLAFPRSSSPPTLSNRVLITSHIDVVPPYIPYSLDHNPLPPSAPLNFTAITPSTLISGRGTVDAKASVAAQITATTLLLQSGAISSSDVVLLFVVGEETSGAGMKHFSASLDDQHNTAATANSRVQFKAAVFGEPTELKLACGHKGIVGGTLTARGKAGHSGYPWQGKSATTLLVRALERLLRADLGSSERYGNTTLNIGVLEGGVAANVIAKEARAKLAVRVAVGDRETGGELVERRMRRLVEEVDKEDLELEIAAASGPVECECDVEGFETTVVNYGTDVANLKGDHVSYLYGPGSILVAHGDDEGLSVKDLEMAVEGYKRLIQHAVEARN